ncbi:MAG: sulfite exporter TauE/SafE family protein [Candidatus Latescibacteria bacterium]|nr:sulfite exporter TauE/SafE family protein [Candidatus Latescibacterota bacterium]
MNTGAEALRLLSTGIAIGWGPCLPFWGPVLLPYIAGTKRSWRGALEISAMFCLGRLLSLAILGALATVAFASINRLFPPHRSGYLYLAVAIFVIVTGVFIGLGKGFKVRPYEILRKWLVDRGAESMLLLGFLIGISPCAPLVAILTYIACTATNLLYGITYALCFGIGTVVPVIVLGTLAGLLPQKIFRSGRALRGFRVICAIILIAFGLEILYNLWHWL